MTKEQILSGGDIVSRELDQTHSAATPKSAAPVYMQADGSDLLGERSAGWVRHVMAEARANFRTKLLYRDLDGDWSVEMTWPPQCPGAMIYGLGDIPSHTDPEYPAHTMLWVLRSGRASVEGRVKRKPQPAGTILAFDCHQRHRLRFDHKSPHRPRLWTAFSLDRPTPWTEADARAAIVAALAGSGPTSVAPQVSQPIREANIPPPVEGE